MCFASFPSRSECQKVPDQGQKVGQRWYRPWQGLETHWTKGQVPQATSWASERLPKGHLSFASRYILMPCIP